MILVPYVGVTIRTGTRTSTRLVGLPTMAMVAGAIAVRATVLPPVAATRTTLIHSPLGRLTLRDTGATGVGLLLATARQVPAALHLETTEGVEVVAVDTVDMVDTADMVDMVGTAHTGGVEAMAEMSTEVMADLLKDTGQPATEIHPREGEAEGGDSHVLIDTNKISCCIIYLNVSRPTQLASGSHVHEFGVTSLR